LRKKCPGREPLFGAEFLLDFKDAVLPPADQE
jgi:hypothetical protein